MVLSDSANFTERATERVGRLKSFSAEMWLRGVRFAEDEDRTSDSNTTDLSPKRADFVFEPPRLTLPKVSNFLSEQEFEAVVLSVDLDNKSFWARLADRTAGLPDEEAEFPFEEVSSDDWPLIIPGAYFSWNIGREVRDGQIRRVSDIRFRRFFRFSTAAIARAAKRASDLESLINESNAYPAGDTAEA